MTDNSANRHHFPEVWPAPAKLNLFLHITGRRADGYHDLQTIFQFLDLTDRLQFAVRDDGKIQRRTAIAQIEPEQDLCFRAARLLQQQTGCQLGVDISIEKILPIGGGLGGGSSDAATTLVALNQLWHLQLSQPQLMVLARQLGADVPVFVSGRAAWAEGVGEKLQPVELPELWYVVIFPGVTIATAQLFADPELTRDARPITIRDYFAGGTHNVFEAIVRRRFPAVQLACEWLSKQRFIRHPAMLTGTGSCVFAAVENETAANDISSKAKRELPNDWQIFNCRSCNESPLFTAQFSALPSD